MASPSSRPAWKVMLQEQFSDLQREFREVLTDLQAKCNGGDLVPLQGFHERLNLFGDRFRLHFEQTDSTDESDADRQELCLMLPRGMSKRPDVPSEGPDGGRGPRTHTLSLTRFSATSEPISDTDVATLVAHILKGDVSTLELWANISDSNLESLLTPVAESTSVKTLQLHPYPPTGPKFVGVLEAFLMKSRTLSSLEVHLKADDELRVRWTADFATALGGCKSLTSFKLKGGRLGMDFLSTLCTKAGTGQTMIDLKLMLDRRDRGGNNLPIEAGDLLGKDSVLQTLVLKKVAGASPGLFALAQALAHNTTLTTLDLTQCSLGQQAAAVLAASLKVNRSLRTLNLEQASIDGRASNSLAQGLEVNKDTVLAELVLQYNSLGNEGARRWLQTLQTNMSLTKLDLVGNDIHDEALVVALESALQKNGKPHLVLNTRLSRLPNGAVRVCCTTLGGNDVVTLEMPSDAALRAVSEAITAALGTQMDAHRRHVRLVLPDGGLFWSKAPTCTLHQVMSPGRVGVPAAGESAEPSESGPKRRRLAD